MGFFYFLILFIFLLISIICLITLMFFISKLFEFYYAFVYLKTIRLKRKRYLKKYTAVFLDKQKKLFNLMYRYVCLFLFWFSVLWFFTII